MVIFGVEQNSIVEWLGVRKQEVVCCVGEVGDSCWVVELCFSLMAWYWVVEKYQS